MLQHLIIENIALIERLEIAFHKGLNVLTGETGAGKSIIIDAINLALGERASRELIKHGALKARVEAIFDVSQSDNLLKRLEELEIPAEDGQLLLTREITAVGKSVCRINGVLAPLAMLKSITDILVDVHGQHEHQSLLNPATHMRFLDSFGHEQIKPLMAELNQIYDAYAACQNELNSGFESEAQRERRMDILRYQINEIESAGLAVGEEDLLNEEKAILANAERIKLAIESTFQALAESNAGCLERLSEAYRSMGEISQYASDYSELSAKLEETYYTLEDAVITLRHLRDTVQFSPERLDQVETRLDTISSLKRKYGESIEEVLRFYRACCDELEALLSSDERRRELKARLSALESKYAATASRLHDARLEAASRLECEIRGQLRDLGLKNAAFSVKTTFNEKAVTRTGMDAVEFMLSANEGEPLKPLSKVASGGETSRIMLAMKNALAGADQIQTLVFDEIDTGISGSVATVVGEKLRSISLSSHQVICITHLPQIAAMADAHFLIEKFIEDRKTYTTIKRLDDSERCLELARIMGGQDSNLALEHAREMLRFAQGTYPY